MPERVTKKVENGEEIWACSKCGAVLIRIEPGGILGSGLISLDQLVILNHYEEKHG